MSPQCGVRVDGVWGDMEMVELPWREAGRVATTADSARLHERREQSLTAVAGELQVTLRLKGLG